MPGNPSYINACHPSHRQHIATTRPVITARILASCDGLPPRHSTSSNGENALARPDHDMITILNTLWLLFNAIASEVNVIAMVDNLSSHVFSMVCGIRSCVSAAEQLSINESAVDMVAANMPASIKPTSAGDNNCIAIVGNASSASKLAASGRWIRASMPTPVAIE